MLRGLPPTPCAGHAWVTSLDADKTQGGRDGKHTWAYPHRWLRSLKRMALSPFRLRFSRESAVQRDGRVGPGLPLSRYPDATFYHLSGERLRLL